MYFACGPSDREIEELLGDKYNITGQLGRGSMGTVYRATHKSLCREDAVKILHPELSRNEAFVEYFIHEARTMAYLNRDNIIRVYDLFERNGQHCIAMEYFEGSSLWALLRAKQKFMLAQIIYIISQIAAGLAHAHDHGIVHRDIKPGNILIDRQAHVKITDFGIAVSLDEAASNMSGDLVGSPRYMSPEQARCEAIDNRSDLFSLGLVFYEMLTGLSPFEGCSRIATIRQLAYLQDEFNLDFPENIPQEVRALIRTLLYRDPEKRINNAAILQEELVNITAYKESIDVDFSIKQLKHCAKL